MPYRYLHMQPLGPHLAMHNIYRSRALTCPLSCPTQEAEGKGGSATEALSGVGRTLASVWADPWVANLRKEWLVYLVQVLTWVYYVVITLLGIKLGFLVLRLFGIDFSD